MFTALMWAMNFGRFKLPHRHRDQRIIHNWRLARHGRWVVAEHHHQCARCDLPMPCYCR